LATFDNSVYPYENWVAKDGCYGYSETLQEGSQSLGLIAKQSANTASSICTTLNNTKRTGIVTVPAVTADYWLKMGLYIKGFSNFDSGYVRIGKDTSNYYQYNITGNIVFNKLMSAYDAVSGTPGTTINYSEVSITSKNTTVTKPTGDIVGFAYGNAVHVCLTRTGAWYSGDAISWTQATTPFTAKLSKIAFGNGIFVAIVNNDPFAETTTNVVMTSTDGIAWTAQTSIALSQCRAICYGKEFVVVNAVGQVMSSMDGIVWTSRTNINNTNWCDITYGNNLYVAVANLHTFAGFPVACTDDLDATSWIITSATDTGCTSGLVDTVAIVYGKNKFVCVQNHNAAVSTDGITWKNWDLKNGWMKLASLTDVSFGNNVFVAVQSNTGAGFVSFWSLDGESWFGDKTLGVQRTVYYADYVFLSGGDSGSLYASVDGKNWDNEYSVIGMFDDLRVEHISTSSLDDSASNITSCSVFDSGINAQGFGGNILALRHSDAVELMDLGGSNYRIKTGLPTQAAPNFTTFTQFNDINNPGRNLLAFADGLTGVYCFNKNGDQQITSITTTPYKYCCAHNNALFLAGDKNNASKIAVSDGANDYFTFQTSSEITVLPKPFSDITGLWSMDDYLVIGRKGDIWNLYGNTFSGDLSDVSIKNSKSKTGPLSQQTGVRVGYSLIFYDGVDIYSYDGSNTNSVTYGSQSEVRGTTANRIIDRLSKANPKYVSLSYNKQRNIVLVHCPVLNTATYTDPIKTADYSKGFTLIFNVDTGAWGEIGRDASVTSIVFCSTTIDRTTFGSSFYTLGLDVRLWDASATETVARTCMYQHQPHHAGTPGINKNFLRYIAYIRDYDSQAQPNPVQMDFYVNGNSATAYSCTGYPVNGRIDTLLMGCNGDSLSCKITKSITAPIDDALEVSGYDFVYTYAGEV
jgi:hypothetical protein